MKSFAIAAALALGAISGGGMATNAAQAAGISGIFQTQPNDQGHIGMVEFYDCGGKYCGRLVRSFDKAGKAIASPSTGKNIVANMTEDGSGAFSGGTIWDPGADKTYKSSMKLDGTTLRVKGCIVAPLCKTQTWTRAK